MTTPVPSPFQEDNLTFARTVLAALPQCATYAYLKGIVRSPEGAGANPAEVFIDTCNTPNDTINIGAYSITQEVRDQEYKSIRGTITTPRLMYVVHETVHIPGSYWEPEDVDIVEFGTEPCFHAALRAIITREAERYHENLIANIGFSMAEENYLLTQEELTDVPY